MSSTLIEEDADAAVEPERPPATTAQSLWGLARAARPRQWVKNLACLAGLIFAGELFRAASAIKAGLAFLGFCLAASGLYLINDVLDRRLDRENPKKRLRPIASGVTPVSWAVATAVLLLAAAIASSWAFRPQTRVVLVCYIALGLAYSFRFKHTVLLDVLIVGLGFVLRVLYGVYAIGVKPSPWIALCMFFLALFLGFAKRRGELRLVGDAGRHRRPVLTKYSVAFLDVLLAMTATMAILSYSIYTVMGHAGALSTAGRQGNSTMVVTVPLVVYGVIRYMLIVMIHGSGDAPDKQLVEDKVAIAIVVAWALLCVTILYTDLRLFQEYTDLLPLHASAAGP